MPTRLGLGTAGREVARAADQFSTTLLARENTVFSRIDETLARYAPAGRVEARLAAGRTPQQIWAEQDTRDWFGAAAEATIIEARGTVYTLGREAGALAADAVVSELDLCARTETARYAGLPQEVADTLVGYAPRAAETFMVAYDAAADHTQTRALRDIAGQFSLAPPEQLMTRLFSPAPARLRGFGGRGVWWRMSTGLHAAARAVAIQTSNAVREAGMDAFNTLGARRG